MNHLSLAVQKLAIFLPHSGKKYTSSGMKLGLCVLPTQKAGCQVQPNNSSKISQLATIMVVTRKEFVAMGTCVPLDFMTVSSKIW